MERMTEKGLVIGLFLEDEPKPREVKKMVVESPATESEPAEEANEAEAPTVTAEIVPQDEAPRRRGRPRKIIN